MGKILKCIALIVFVCALSLQTFAHPEDLQNDGTPEQGHYDRSTGEYHYHHSNIHEGACQYPADECPLNTENKAASVYEPEKSKQGESDSNKPKSYITSNDSNSVGGIIAEALAFFVFMLLPAVVMVYLIASYIKENIKPHKKSDSKAEQSVAVSDASIHAPTRTEKEKPEEPLADSQKPSAEPQNKAQKPKAKRVKMVYYTPRGKSFHRIKSCPKLSRSRNIKKAPFDEMKWELLPCETCYKNHWKYM